MNIIEINHSLCNNHFIAGYYYREQIQNPILFQNNMKFKNFSPIIQNPILISPDEFFVELINVVPNILPYYIISNYGRIFNFYSQKFLSLQERNEYLRVRLSLCNDQEIISSLFSVHRLVMMTFCYFPGCETLEVNHKDGNKKHNWVNNLEWCTRLENINHAKMNNLFHGIDNEKVHTICQLLEKGMSIGEISLSLNVSYSVIKHIKFKESHIDISNQYIF